MPTIRMLLAMLMLAAAGVAQATDDAVFVSAKASSDVATSRRRVPVAGGGYDGFAMVNGVDVIGGYGQNFERGAAAEGPTVSEVRGVFLSGIGQEAAVLAQGITQATRLAGLTLRQAMTGAAGRNSIGLVIRGSSSALTVSAKTMSAARVAPADRTARPDRGAAEVPAVPAASRAPTVERFLRT